MWLSLHVDVYVNVWACREWWGFASMSFFGWCRVCVFLARGIVTRAAALVVHQVITSLDYASGAR